MPRGRKRKQAEESMEDNFDEQEEFDDGIADRDLDYFAGISPVATESLRSPVLDDDEKVHELGCPGGRDCFCEE